MMRAASLVTACLASPVAANTASFSCTVVEMCSFVDARKSQCSQATSARTFGLEIERGPDDFDAKANVTFEAQSVTLDLNTIGHGSPPPVLENTSSDDEQDTALDTVPTEQVWAMGGLTFGTTDNHYLAISTGYSDGRPDTAQLVLASDTTPLSYSAICTCVGDSTC